MDFIEILEKEIGKKSIKIFEEIKEANVKDSASENGSYKKLDKIILLKQN